MRSCLCACLRAYMRACVCTLIIWCAQLSSVNSPGEYLEGVPHKPVHEKCTQHAHTRMCTNLHVYEGVHGRKDGRSDGRTDGRAGGRAGGRASRQMERQTDGYTHAEMPASMHACMHANMHAHTRSCAYSPTHKYELANTYLLTLLLMHTNACMHMRTHASKQAKTPACAHR